MLTNDTKYFWALEFMQLFFRDKGKHNLQGIVQSTSYASPFIFGVLTGECQSFFPNLSAGDST